MRNKTVYQRPPESLEAFKAQVAGLSHNNLVAIQKELEAARVAVRSDLRQISSTNALTGEAREYAKNKCLHERDMLGTKIAYVINLLSRMKQIKKGLKPKPKTKPQTRDMKKATKVNKKIAAQTGPGLALAAYKKTPQYEVLTESIFRRSEFINAMQDRVSRAFAAGYKARASECDPDQVPRYEISDTNGLAEAISAADAARLSGLKSEKQMSQISGVPTRTLYDMFHDNRKHFDALAIGCAEIAKQRP